MANADVKFPLQTARRRQGFDHESGAVRYYLGREVRFYAQAAFLGRPSDDDDDDDVQNPARIMTLTVDPHTPIDLPDGMKEKIAKSKRVARIGSKGREIDLDIKLREKYGFIRQAPPNDPVARIEGKRPDSILHRTEAKAAELEKSPKATLLYYRHGYN